MKILFIFHEYNHTGATIVLYRNILWLKNNGIEPYLLITGHGSLENDIRKLGKSYNWHYEDDIIDTSTLFGRIRRKIRKNFPKPKRYKKVLFEQLNNEKFDLIYANTICSSVYIKELGFLNKPVIWHLHELELAINLLGREHLDIHDQVNCFIANSNATKSNLIKSHNIDGNKIIVHYPCINITDIQLKKDDKFDIVKALSLPDDSFIIGTSGTVFSQKGSDAFFMLIRIIEEIFPNNNFHYIWVGHNWIKFETDRDIELTGLKNKITFTGNLGNPVPYYQSFDVFLSLSKQESFGLAAVEVSLLEKPIVFFDKTEGLSEIFSDKTGGEIPYLNLNVMANKLIELYKNPDLRKSLGKEARNIGEKFDENIIMPELLKTITNIKNRSRKDAE
jgi:glycosyltransferase involved in cell wall biosynthesis